MRRSPSIFSVYMPSDHATTSSNITPGPRGCKFPCKREPFFDHARRVTSPTWGPPPPCKQALKLGNIRPRDASRPIARERKYLMDYNYQYTLGSS